MKKTNEFATPTYTRKDFGSMEAVKRHLEYKINAVIEEHRDYWKIVSIKRRINNDCASAIIYMERYE